MVFYKSFCVRPPLKYLLNNKLAKYPKSNENKNEPKNIGYYSINKNVMAAKCQMSNLNVELQKAIRVDEN